MVLVNRRKGIAGAQREAMDLSDFRERVRALTQSRQQLGRRRANTPPSVAEQVEQSVQKLIIDGDFPPGMRLLETDLATRFGVSRAPVRDALRMLDKQGFVELTPRRGAVVHQPTPADISHLYEIRAELFALAGRKAAAAMDAEMRAVAEIGLRLMSSLANDAATSAASFFEARTGLGALVLLAANNPRLTDVVNVLGMQATTHIQVFGTAAHRRHNAQGWRRLYDAIAAHDEAGAATEARKLVVDSRDELLRQMREAAAATPA